MFHITCGREARGARWTAAALGVALFSVLAAQAVAQPGPLERLLCEEDLAPPELRPDDLFGCALDAAGDVLVVGSVNDDGRGRDAGAVYVFEDAGQGFRRTAYLTAAAVAPGDRLGYAVATDGGQFVAGAPFHDEGTASDAGAAWVFRRAGGGWVEEAQLLAGGLAGGLGRVDLFGYAVAIDGGVAAVGAPGDDDRGDAAGAVWVFERGGDGAWQPVAKLVDAAGAVGDGFGSSLALDGGTLLVGAPYRAGAAGAVAVFRRGGDGTWTQGATLFGDGGASSLFGHAVSLDGAWAAVGARGDDRGGRNAGAVHVFRRAGDGFAPAGRLALPAGEAAAGDELGIGVSVDGGRLLAGARFDDEGARNSGAAYLFRLGDGAWRAAAKLKAAQPSAGDELGYAVAVAGEGLFTGAYLADGHGADAGTICAASDEEEQPPRPDPDPDPDPAPEPTAPAVTAAKSLLSGPHAEGWPVIYEILLVNAGDGPWANGPGAELTDVLPPALGGVTATADAGVATVVAPPSAAGIGATTSGTAKSTQASRAAQEGTRRSHGRLGAVSAGDAVVSFGNGAVVTWDGDVPAGGTVRIEVRAVVLQEPEVVTLAARPGAAGGAPRAAAPAVGDVVCNQAVLAASSGGPALSDDPSLPGAADPTCFTIMPELAIPTLHPAALAALALLLAAAGWRAARRRRPGRGQPG